MQDIKEIRTATITSKGQITIPQDIRNKFSFLPGMDVDVITEGNKVLIVKSRRENTFIKWLGRGKRRSRRGVDFTVDQLRGSMNGNARMPLHSFEKGSEMLTDIQYGVGASDFPQVAAQRRFALDQGDVKAGLGDR